ncbi:MAG: hypothetical protein JXP73_16670 [Deltaproteobacteria bacterium]|nr:hypothetical protein [Deltaproteobacteria bacterium]
MNATALLCSVLVSSVGLGLFVYGKKQRRGLHLAAGILLIVYPYFVSSIALMFIIAAAVLGLLYLGKHLGI